MGDVVHVDFQAAKEQDELRQADGREEFFENKMKSLQKKIEREVNSEDPDERKIKLLKGHLSTVSKRLQAVRSEDEDGNS